MYPATPDEDSFRGKLRLAGGPGGRCRVFTRKREFRGRKVRTPQGSVPDNVRDVGWKARRRPVPQKRYRLGYPVNAITYVGLRGRATLERQPSFLGWLPRCRGKGEMVRQERTAPAVRPEAG
jgi:hypothetical protein